MMDIHDNTDAHRFELEIEGQTAVAIYNLSGRNLMITEVLVPPPLEGRGVAGRLMQHVVAEAQARDLLIQPVCPYASAWLRKHPDHADAVHPTWRAILGVSPRHSKS